MKDQIFNCKSVDQSKSMKLEVANHLLLNSKNNDGIAKEDRTNAATKIVNISGCSNVIINL